MHLRPGFMKALHKLRLTFKCNVTSILTSSRLPNNLDGITLVLLITNTSPGFNIFGKSLNLRSSETFSIQFNKRELSLG